MGNNYKTQHYQGFRGIDLSSDPTLCSPSRSPFMVNMYKDYKASFGKAVETFPGFRKRVEFPISDDDDNTVHDIFFKRYCTDGGELTVPFIHVGKRLYKWHCYPEPIGAERELGCVVQDNSITLDFAIKSLISVEIDGEKVTATLKADKTSILLIGEFDDGTIAKITYIKHGFSSEHLLYDTLPERKLKFINKGDEFYIITGSALLKCDENLSVSAVLPLIPTTYIGITADSVGTQYQYRNMLTDSFKNTILADGTTTLFHLSEQSIDGITSVKLYGEVLVGAEEPADVVTATEDTEIDYYYNLTDGTIRFVTAPSSPQDEEFEDGYCGIEVQAYRAVDGHSTMVNSMKRASVYDNRLFLVNNDNHANTVVYSALDDYSYFPEINYVNIGTSSSKIVDIALCGDDLFVFKEDSENGSLFELNSYDTDIDNNPKAYSVTALPMTLGTVSNAFYFLDEPIYISRLGIKCIASPDLKNQRIVEHRSSLIDSELLYKGIENSQLFEWNGYLCCYVNGVLYLGDSRQRFLSELQHREYEWFKIDGIASYDNQYQRYKYSDKMVNELGDTVKLAPKELYGTTANLPKADGTPTLEVTKHTKLIDNINITYYTVTLEIKLAVDLIEGDIEYETVTETYLVEPCEDYIGGVKNNATCMVNSEENLYFGNVGAVYSFNFDKRIDGQIDSNYYNFNKRTIMSGLATCLDNVGYPNMLKNTARKSLVIKCKTMHGSHAKVKVRTDKTTYKQVGDINNSYFDFNTTNFKTLSFNTSDQQIFMCDEKEKRWVEKQILIYQDQYNRPFSVYYVTYRYRILSPIK